MSPKKIQKRITNRTMRESQQAVINDLMQHSHILQVILGALQNHNIIAMTPSEGGMKIEAVDPSPIVKPQGLIVP